jgi:hypothetical protein
MDFGSSHAWVGADDAVEVVEEGIVPPLLSFLSFIDVEIYL